MLSKPCQIIDEIKADFQMLLFEIKMNGIRSGLNKVYQVFIAYVRYVFFPLLPVYVQEQIVKRHIDAKCSHLKRCQSCGCKMPFKLYAEGSCGEDCYLEFMNEVDWLIYKKNNNVTFKGKRFRKRF
jgi:hypothetical protein